MPFVHHATVRFFEVDRAGIAFFAAIFPLCHAAWEEVMAQVWSPDSLEQVLVDGRWCLPVVRAEADYRAPMRLGERLCVRPSIHRLGDRSLAIDYLVVGATDALLRAEVRLTHAVMAPGSPGPAVPRGDDGPPPTGARGARLPDSLAARLRAVLEATA